MEYIFTTRAFASVGFSSIATLNPKYNFKVCFIGLQIVSLFSESLRSRGDCTIETASSSLHSFSFSSTLFSLDVKFYNVMKTFYIAFLVLISTFLCSMRVVGLRIGVNFNILLLYMRKYSICDNIQRSFSIATVYHGRMQYFHALTRDL